MTILERKYWGIKGKELLFMLFFYLFFAFSYHFTLWVDEQGYRRGYFSFFSFSEFIDLSGLDYLIKGLITIPIWWLIFRKLRHWKLVYRLLIHLITLPIFIITFIAIYYKISDYFNFFHLTGNRMIWDIYIPSLFYFVQFGIFHSYEYYQDNLRNIALKAELNKAAIKSELAALKAQLNPHFLYNTFNTISASVPAEMETTREMIARLSDLFRYQLKGTKSEVVPLKEEIEFISTYLELEKERFGDRLSYDFHIDPDAYERMIPPMILQPLVENAVKHGISPRIKGGKIDLHIKANEQETHFELYDDGIGMGNGIKGNGIGLSNTQLRLDKMYAEPLHISSEPGKGVCIKFKIPLNAKSSHN